MSFSEIEIKRIQKVVGAFIEKRRPPPHIRPKLDFGFRIDRQSVELFEIRPVFDDPERYQESPFAKATYVQTKKLWMVYWMRSDLKWHGYTPAPAVKRIEDLIVLVDRDDHGCFFG